MLRQLMIVYHIIVTHCHFDSLSLCVCLCVISGEMFIPFYTGKVIDIIGSHYQQSEFLSALLFMGLYSIGG